MIYKKITHLFGIGFLLLISLGAHAQLPAPVPNIESIVSGSPSPGNLFIGPRSRNVTDTLPSSIMVCDSVGQPIWHSSIVVPNTPSYANAFPADFKLLNDSTMSYCIRPYGNYVFHFLDRDFNLIDTLICVPDDTDEHEMIEDLQGNRYYLCKQFSNEDCSGLNTIDGLPGGSNCNVLSIRLVVEDPAGNTLWTWNTLDHISIPETSPFYFFTPNYLDHAHTNSIAFDLDSNLVLSHRNNFQIMKINRTNGDVMWRLGGVNNEFTFIGDSIQFTGQHDARILPNGNLSIFDNGTFQQFARYIEYELDTVAMTATLVREHRHPTLENAAIMGSSQYLPDSNVLACWGGHFTTFHTPKITEYAPDGSITMQVKLPYEYTSYRAYKEVLPFALERPEVTCDNGSLTFSAPPGYSTYAWNTGDTTQTISVTSPGTYQVWVNHGIGFLNSRKYVVTDINNICLALNQENPTHETLSGYPNPFEDRLTLEIPLQLAGAWDAEAFDITGKRMGFQSGKGYGEVVFPTEAWPAGMYFVRLSGMKGYYLGKFTKQ